MYKRQVHDAVVAGALVAQYGFIAEDQLLLFTDGGHGVRVQLHPEMCIRDRWSTASFETGLAQADWQGVWACPETEEPDIDCADAINAFAKPNWEQKRCV